MNSITPLVSILVPIYGVEEYIERCARSIFEQTYPNLEFVFVDDASPDKSVEILQRVILCYPKWEGRIIIIHHDKNLGLAAARNTLVDNCKGEFLFHVDSDDWIEPNAVEQLVKRQFETDADIVSGLFYRHNYSDNQEETLKRILLLKERDREETLEAMLNYGSIVATWNRLIRSSLYREPNIRYVEGIDAGEDLLITPRLVYYSRKVATLNVITYHYNQCNSNSYVNVLPHSWDMQLQLIRATQLNIEFFRDKEVSYSESMNKQFAIRLMKMLELTFKNQNRYGFNNVLALLDDTDKKYWPLIGWDKPQKRWLDHHYYFTRLFAAIKHEHGE